jgi:hypothetical protein
VLLLLSDIGNKEAGKMAQRVVTLLTDDIDGDEAAETVRFGVDGTEFEIDLNEENASAFREALRPYVQKGRRSGGRATASPGRRAAATNTKTDPAQLKAIRGWAKDQNLKVSDRGRISADILSAYEAAH